MRDKESSCQNRAERDKEKGIERERQEKTNKGRAREQKEEQEFFAMIDKELAEIVSHLSPRVLSIPLFK